MPGTDIVSVLPTGLFLLLAVIYVVLQPTHPERKSLPGQRMTRIAAKVAIEFVVMVFVIVRLFVASVESLGPTAAAEGSIAPIAWGRAGLAAGSVSGVAVGVILLAMALVAVATQYVANRTFSRQSLGPRLDSLRRTTGTAERMVYALGAVITAGVGEEVVFRALLPAIFYAITSNIAVAILVPLFFFAVLHFDQGYKGILNAALVGAVATVVFLVTQQLWWAIALHAVANLVATIVAPEIVRARVRQVAREAVQLSSQKSLLSGAVGRE